MQLIASLSASAARRIGELGFIVGAIGGLVLVLGALRAGQTSASGARALLSIAGLCITVGFVLGIVALHWD